MLSLISSLARDTRGATAIEYALIAAVLSMAAIIAMRAIGIRSADVMNTVALAFS